jgi:hypothetical protein
MITATVSLNVTPLVDNEIAFANAAAWNDYFNNLTGEVELDAITTTGYTDSPYDTTLTPHELTVDLTLYVFPTLDMFSSLKAQVQALDNNYIILRGELYAAGLISTP